MLSTLLNILSDAVFCIAFQSKQCMSQKIANQVDAAELFYTTIEPMSFVILRVINILEK